MLYLRVIFIGLIILSFATYSILNAQGEDSNKISMKKDKPTPQDSVEIRKAADDFVQLFRRTLDFGVAFNKFSVADSIRRMRFANFFASVNFDDNLVKKSSDASLRRAYNALMNLYYLKAVYDLNLRRDSKPELALPTEIERALQKSKYLKTLLQDVSDDGPVVKTQKDLQRFINDYEQVTTLYRKRLPSNPFGDVYQNNLSRLHPQNTSVRTQSGYPEYDFSQDIKVYSIRQDLFEFFFIKVKSDFKVLILGIGN